MIPYSSVVCGLPILPFSFRSARADETFCDRIIHEYISFIKYTILDGKGCTFESDGEKVAQPVELSLFSSVALCTRAGERLKYK